MTKNHNWTEEENDVIRREYRHDRASADRLAEQFGVSFQAIRSRITRLGLARSSRRVPWAPEDDERLQEILPKHPIGQVARMMGRGINPVMVRAHRLGLSRRYHDGWYTKMEVARLCGVDHHMVQSWIDAKALLASYHNGQRPQRDGQAAWHIARKDLRAFIRHHPEELNGRQVDMIGLVEVLAGIAAPRSHA